MHGFISACKGVAKHQKDAQHLPLSPPRERTKVRGIKFKLTDFITHDHLRSKAEGSFATVSAKGKRDTRVASTDLTFAKGTTYDVIHAVDQPDSEAPLLSRE